jgi:cytochrome c oxidase cbb3-type subunit I
MSSMESSLTQSGTSAIDSSAKGPVLVYLFSALKWLFIASIFGYLASWKTHNPDFLNGWSFLTVGRVQAVYTTAFVYGFGCNIAFGMGLWLISRLSGEKLRYTIALIIAAAVWNIALTVGLVGIFMGHLNAFEFLELPSYVKLPLLLSSIVVSVWGLLTFKNRKNADVFASEWYLLAAFLVFPWIQIVAQVMLFTKPAPGVMQGLVASWVASNLVWLWFGSIAVAGLYYLVPKLLGKQIVAYGLAKIGFIVLVFAGSWMGAAKLVGGPLPAWMITSGIAASLLMIIFFSITGINLFGTVWKNRSGICDNGTFLFVGFASLALILSGVGVLLASLRGFAEVTQFTIFLDAHRFLILYGVFSMTMFALIYYAFPKLLGREWTMDFMISTHFWIAFIGIILLVGPLAIGGWQQGAAMNDASVPFADIVRHTSYWMVSRSMAWIFLTIGHLCLILNVLATLRPECEAIVEELTRTDDPSAGGVES